MRTRVPSHQFAALAQSGGYSAGTLCVTAGSPWPHVFAFVLDVEIDLFRIDFSSDGTFTIDTDALSYLMLEPAHLREIQALAKEAARMWKIIDRRAAALASGLDGYEGPDPFADLYTAAPVPMPKSFRVAGLDASACSRSCESLGFPAPGRPACEDPACRDEVWSAPDVGCASARSTASSVAFGKSDSYAFCGTSRRKAG